MASQSLRQQLLQELTASRPATAYRHKQMNHIALTIHTGQMLSQNKIFEGGCRGKRTGNPLGFLNSN
jgi:hypothetical protein